MITPDLEAQPHISEHGQPQRPSPPVSSRASSVALTLGEPQTITVEAERTSGKQGNPSIVPKGNTNDILVIDWDGPEDPENPKNWNIHRKWVATFIVSAFTFITPVSSSMIAPASENLAREFGITNTIVIALTTSAFVLGYAIGPLFLGPLSEIYGRSRVLQWSNLWYLAWNLGCGFSRNTEQLITFRFLAGAGGSATMSIGGGVIADCWKTEQRGQAIAIYSLAPLLGPVMGPVCGAWIVEKTTWRWVFWSTSIVDVMIQFFGFFYLDESYAPVLLERKADKIRKTIGAKKAQHQHVRTVFESDDRHWKGIMSKALARPFAIFFREPIMQLLGAYMAFIYGLIYLFLTTMPSIFSGVYHEKTGIAGLHYLALGVGLSGASQVNARMLDKVYVYFQKKNGGVGRPEFRLPSMFPGTICLPLGLLMTGWTVENHVFWFVPDIGIALVAAGIILNFQSIQSYVVDTFTLHAASALAAVSCLRSLAGFGFPLFAPDMYKALGYGKGDTVLAVFAIIIGCPAPWLFWHYGERIRKSSRYTKT